MLQEIAQEYQFRILAMEVMPDHIHLLLDCKPQFFISDMIKIMKGNLARQLFLAHPELKRELWGGHLWNPSYCAVTVSDRSREQIMAYIEGQKEMLAKPQTFMNLSGDSVSALVNFYKLDPTQELIVVFDDISLAPGNLRIRKKGSAGGHNGIKDIIAKTGTDQFERVKVGVGEKPAGWDLADHVLGRFSPEDREKFEDAVKDAVDAVSLMVQDRTDEAMNLYNRKKEA